MEDAHMFETIKVTTDYDVHIAGVFDGHGGQEVAIYVKKHLTELLKKSPEFKKANYELALKQAFLLIDDCLRSKSGKQELAQISSSLSKTATLAETNPSDLAASIGCTACVALITKTDIFVANSGDSRAVLCRSGKAIAMSEDHKPDLEKEKKRIEKAGGFVDDNRVNGVLNLSRCLGDLDYKKGASLKPEEQMISAMPDVRKEKITADTEFLILGCDGIWECLTNEQAVDIMKKKTYGTYVGKVEKGRLVKSVAEVLDQIIAKDTESQDPIGCDNMTCLVIQFIK